jgi:hypothetical protein
MAGFFMELFLKFSDLSYPGEGASDDLRMPISQKRLRDWLRQGLLSGYAGKVSGKWRFASGIVEIAQLRHKELGARQPPQHPKIASGYLGLGQWAKEAGVSYGQVYRGLANTSGQPCQIELGIRKDKGYWLIPAAMTSDAIVVVLGRASIPDSGDVAKDQVNHIEFQIPGTPYQSGLLQIRYYVPRMPQEKT